MLEFQSNKGGEGGRGDDRRRVFLMMALKLCNYVPYHICPSLFFFVRLLRSYLLVGFTFAG